MSESTGGSRIERILIRILLGALAVYTGYLQTGQISLQGGEVVRDTDTVALLKVVHRLELRIQRLEDLRSSDLGPLVVEDVVSMPPPPSLEPADIRKAFEKIRSLVTEKEVETYQQER